MHRLGIKEELIMGAEIAKDEFLLPGCHEEICFSVEFVIHMPAESFTRHFFLQPQRIMDSNLRNRAIHTIGATIGTYEMQ